MALKYQIQRDRVAEDFSVGYVNDSLATTWDKFPTSEQPQSSFQYLSRSREYQELKDLEWAEGAEAVQIDYNYTKVDVNLIRYGNSTWLDNDYIAEAMSPIEPSQESAEVLMENMTIANEALLGVSLNAISQTSSPTVKWNLVNSTITADIEAAFGTMIANGCPAIRSNLTLVLPYAVYSALLTSEELRDLRRGANGVATTNEQLLASQLNIGRVVVSNVVKRTSAKNAATATYGSALTSTSAWLVYSAPSVRRSQPTGLLHLVRSGSVRIDTWQEPAKNKTWWRLRRIHGFVLPSAECAYKFTNVI